MIEKINTTEQAIDGLKEQFRKFGLTDSGDVPKQDNDILMASVEKGVKGRMQIQDKGTSYLSTKEIGDVFTKAMQQSDENIEEASAEINKESAPQAVEDSPQKLKEKKETPSAEFLELQRTINKLNEKLEKQEQQLILAEKEKFEQQRKEAISKGDYESVKAIEQQRSPQIDPAIAEFHKNNPWYNGKTNEEMEMTASADTYASVLFRNNISPKEAMRLLEEHAKSKFPKYFSINTEQNEEPIAQVIENVNSGIAKKSKRSYTIDNLDKEAQHIIKEFNRLSRGKVEPKKYIEDLYAAGLIKHE